MKIFILGLIFGLFVQPLLEGLTSLLLSFFEMIKSYFGLKITINNQRIQELSNQNTPTHPIGFDIGGEVEDYDL